MEFVEILYGAIIGAALGSFLGAAYYRLPKRMPMTGRSRCPTCKEQLSVADNIPVGSWLVLFGKSSCCKTRISSHYFIFELAMLIIGALAVYWVGLLITFAGAAAIIIITSTISAFNQKRF
jgi:leader peptidase (prepilin peptidase)/N-methyltransferase